ncbi:unnamed protein product, partial [Ceratitis capitata]
MHLRFLAFAMLFELVVALTGGFCLAVILWSVDTLGLMAWNVDNVDGIRCLAAFFLLRHLQQKRKFSLHNCTL